MSIQSAETVNVLDNTSDLAAHAVDNIYIKKIWRKEGNYVSKYASVDEAVKWTKDFIEGVNKNHREWLYLNRRNGRRVNVEKYDELFQELKIIYENWSTISTVLETKLTSEVDKKVLENKITNEINSKPAKKIGTLQRIRNIRNSHKPKHDNNIVIKNEDNIVVDNIVILKDVVNEVLVELGFSTRPLTFLHEASIVTKDYFAGITGAVRNRNVTYETGMREPTRMNSVAYKKLDALLEKQKNAHLR